MNEVDINPHIRGLIRAMLNKHLIGGKHTEEKNILKRVQHLPRREVKDIVRAWEMVVHAGIVLRKKSTGEIHVSLNPRKLEEIQDIVGDCT